MDARESVDLTKMAVTAMLVTLVLSAMLSLFFFLYVQLSKTTAGTQQIVSLTTTDKLHDLGNASASGDNPWVTSIINALTEADDPNLLYVQVIDTTVTPNTTLYFTYENVNLAGPPAIQVKKLSSPLDEVCKYLMGYTNKRCGVVYLSGDKGIVYGDMRYDCLQLTILK